MWQVKDHTPFASQGYFVRDKDGAEHWVVALRGSFDMRADGLCALAQDQTPVRLAPRYDDTDPSILLEESDFQPFRPAADIAVYGTAVSPDGTPVPVIEVGVTVGRMSKTLHVTGPRSVTKRMFSYEMGEPDLFDSLPLSWTYALGGQSQRPDEATAQAPTHDANPVGMGWLHDWRTLQKGDHVELPRIFDPKAPVTPANDFPQPQSFGAVQPDWGPRRKHAGTYDDAWNKTRHPRLPLDYDDRFSHSVLPDQTAELVGGEPVELRGLTPEGTRSFRLPQIVATAFTRIGQQTHDTRFRLIAVMIDSDQDRLELVWNTSIPCNGRDMDVESSSVRVRQMSGVTT